MKRTILEVGSGSRTEVNVPLENYRVRHFSPMCALADVFLDLVSPDKEVKEKIYGDFVVADAQKLPFKDEIFDEIYARHLIEHIPNYVSFLSECYRVLKLNGRFYIVCPNYYSYQATHKRPLSRNTDPTHVNVFTNMRLSLMLKKVGFRIVSLKSQLATYYPIPAYLLWILNFFFAEEIRLVATK